MPIYEYKCTNGHVFDVMQKMSDDPVSSCIECGASVRKVLQPVGISFKGSGFYSTDYSKKGPKTETSSASSTGNGDSGSSEKSSGEKSGTAEKTGASKSDNKSSGSTASKSSDK